VERSPERAQDAVLTGYASAITPEAARDGGGRHCGRWTASRRCLRTRDRGSPALWSRSPPVDARGRAAMCSRRHSAGVAGRGRMAVSMPWEPETFSDAFGHAVRETTHGPASSKGSAGHREDVEPVKAVVQYAAEARARGVLRQWSRVRASPFECDAAATARAQWRALGPVH
jgi:hypothetical protein